jgi:hypothetical protein
MKVAAISAMTILVIFMLGIGITVYYYPQAYFLFFRDPLWVSVFVTVMLAVINGIYALQIRQTITEMRKARMAEFVPHIRADLGFFGIIPAVKITNFGKGPAIDVKMRITYFPSKQERLWEQTAMSPNESTHFMLPGEIMREILERASQVVVHGEYKDIFDKVYKIEDEMNVKEFIEQTEKSVPLLEENLSMIVKGIVGELRGIENQLRDISGKLKKQDRS